MACQWGCGINYLPFVADGNRLMIIMMIKNLTKMSGESHIRHGVRSSVGSGKMGDDITNQNWKRDLGKV